MSTIELLRAHAPVAPERLHERVLELRPSRPPRRRVRPLLVLAAAATLAVAAAVVHGLSTSAPQPQPLIPHSVGSVKAAPVPAWTTATDSAHGALVAGGGAQRVIAVPSSPNRLQHTDASIRVRVDDVGAATTRATRIATSLGGYAQSVVEHSPESVLDLRVPAQNVQKAVSELAGLGTIVSQQISVEDLTNALQRQSAEIAQLRRRIAALHAALRDPALPDAQRVLLQIKLAESKRALSQRVHARKGTVAAGTSARISLVLTTQKHAVVVHHRGRLGRMFHSAVGFLAIEGMVALFALIVVSPIAIALALLWLYRRRAVERLLME